MQEITMKAVIDNIPAVTEFIDAQLEAVDCPMKAQMQIDMAIDEIFSNISRYAYPDGPGSATVRLSFDEGSRMFSICFEDQGIPFDPLKQEEPDTTLDTEARAIGGLGIFLVRKTMDEVSYQYRDGCNILCLKKKI